MEDQGRRLPHYGLLLAIAAVLFLPYLGAPSLWDIDEGHNAEAAREMRESGNWIVPTFNFQLRVDKPALLYWLQMAAYELCGVHEFAARLPSVLASVLAMLAVYELGRAMFPGSVGLLAGVILGSTIAFCGAGRFANPDALLNLFSLLTLTCFWLGYSRGVASWFLAAGVAAGLAVLAKGPVGVVLPGAIVLVFLLLTRRLGILVNRWVGWGLFACVAVALPWYIWVSVDTRADFLRGFLLTHNVNRFLSPMENHRGPWWYYLAVVLVGFAPWSAFFGLTLWSSIREWRSPPGADGERPELARQRHLFLWCWMGAFVLFFTAASTKLPNYVLPLYPALALLTARCLVLWVESKLPVAAGVFRLGLVSLGLIGTAVVLGLLIAGGVLPVEALRLRVLAGLEQWAFLGVFPLAGAVAAGWLMGTRRPAALGCVAAASVLFVAGLASGGAWALDRHKAARPLGMAIQQAMPEPEIRIGCFGYYQPSLVFYCRRKVERLENLERAMEFLQQPLPSYLFLPADAIGSFLQQVDGPIYQLGKHFDLYRGYDVVVVSNRPAHSP